MNFDPEYLLSTYGYAALFIGTFLEGETILIIAGMLAHTGLLSLPMCILFAFLGTMFGDQLYFYIGRYKGKSLLAKRPLWKERAERVSVHLRRHETLVILLFRFFYGLRNVTPFVIGVSDISPVKYGVLNFFGALVWALAFGLGGFYLGKAMTLFIEDVKKYQVSIGLGLLAVFGLIWLGRALYMKRKKAKKDAEWE